MANRLEDTPKLGFGLMRLPHRGVVTDIEQTKRMVDLFMDAGFTYFDTAYVYPGSEAAAKKALVDRHPRDSFTLATKLHVMAGPSPKLARKELETSLKKTGAGYFDFYLLHSLMGNNYKLYDEYGLWDFVQEKKKEGVIRHAGFSFHAGPELLDQLLTEHPEVDFVQLQINYADWENPKVTSRANYEMARKHNKPIVVMEPVKGGKLANVPAEVKKLFEGYAPGASPASWAIRFAASLEGILTVLSGMSNVAQMEDNLSYMRQFKPLNNDERKIIQEAQRILGKAGTIPCTACRYCVEGCPRNIPIPEIFSAMNARIGNGQMAESAELYKKATEGKGKASDCVECRQCENACPQHLQIVDLLKDCAVLEK